MKPLIYTIIEYQSFGVDEIATTLECDEAKAHKFFKALEDFQKSHEDNSKFLKHLSKTKLKAQNYVGIIQTPYGTLEILPKCFRGDILPKDERENKKDKEEENYKRRQTKQEQKEKIKEFFKINSFREQLENEGIQDFTHIDTPQKSAQAFLLHCLATLKKTPFKQIQSSSLSTAYTPLLEIFIQMFCQELFELCKKGIRHDYVAIEDNRHYLKGKLLFNQQIRYNLAHKERFYTSSDEYVADIAPNRLIKSTLKLLSTKSTSSKTKILINSGLEIFEEIPPSINHKADFLSCTTSRHFSYYDTILSWCKLFLDGNSFTPYSGESQAYALLFPMEKLFESYVAYMLKKSNPSTTIHTQSSGGQTQYLLHFNQANQVSKFFQLKPDLAFELGEEKIIADTKWKPLKNAEDKKSGIAQGDLYQLFAYAHYHKAKEVWLIYPKLYTQESKDNEFEDIVKNLKEWNKKEPHYCHPCIFEESSHKINLKVFFAPLAFH